MIYKVWEVVDWDADTEEFDDYDSAAAYAREQSDTSSYVVALVTQAEGSPVPVAKELWMDGEVYRKEPPQI